MDYLSVFFVGLAGLILGSFLSVLVSRLDKKEGIIAGRSECPHCFHKLAWYDLIPLFSFIFLGGRCRYCKSSVSSFYPLIEITTAMVLIAYFLVNGLAFNLAAYYHVALLVLLVSLIFFDALYLLLPDKVLFTIGGITFVYGIFFKLEEISHLFIFGLLFALGFAIIYLVSRGKAMGFGDVKLAFVIGLILGYPLGFLAIILAIWAGALWGIGLMLFGKATPKTALPFGSFLSATTIIFIIFSNDVQEKINTIQYLF